MSAALQGESQYSSPGPTPFTPTILPIVTSGEKEALQRRYRWIERAWSSWPPAFIHTT
jgi:hypothetical protein